VGWAGDLGLCVRDLGPRDAKKEGKKMIRDSPEGRGAVRPHPACHCGIANVASPLNP
jgi:hypothetical protein